MRILWFTNTPSNASEEFGFKSFGGGWISSLEAFFAETKKHDLGICFFYSGRTFKKIEKGHVVYYGVPLKEGNAFHRIIIRQRAKLIDEDQHSFARVIDDFKPDIIHIFGTEVGYGKSLMNRSEKILVNIQGLMNPIADVYFPPGFNSVKILMRSNLSSILKGLTSFHSYRYVRKMAEREKITMSFFKYFIGRTDWDRNYLSLVNPDAKYFHCEEMLRKDFFENEWKQPYEITNTNEIVISSTISPRPFKGLDLIYKVLNLMSGYNIRWKVFGITSGDDLNMIVRKNLTKDMKSPDIEFCGQIKPGELKKQLLTCHFYVHPSYMDNSSNSVCEAMLLGMPVIAPFVGGIKTLVNNGETGFLFNPYDKYDLAGLLVHLINNYEIALKAGTNARKIALRRHSPAKILSDLDQIYNYIYNDD